MKKITNLRKGGREARQGRAGQKRKTNLK